MYSMRFVNAEVQVTKSSHSGDALHIDAAESMRDCSSVVRVVACTVLGASMLIDMVSTGGMDLL